MPVARPLSGHEPNTMTQPDVDLELRILSPSQTTELIPLTLAQMLAFAAVGKFPRAVKIDHMQPPKARRLKPFCGFERVVGIHRLPRKITLREPHTFAADQIHSRDYFDHIVRKFSRMLSPTAPDFSG